MRVTETLYAAMQDQGLTEADLARKVSQFNAGLILNHMRGTPETWAKLPPLKNVLQTIVGELDAAVHRAVRAGVDRKHIVVDPERDGGLGRQRPQTSPNDASYNVTNVGLGVLVCRSARLGYRLEANPISVGFH